MVVHLGAQQSQQRRGGKAAQLRAGSGTVAAPTANSHAAVHAGAERREKLSRNVNSALQNYNP